MGKKSKFFENLTGKIEICFVKLPEKIEIFRKVAWNNRSFFVKLPEKSKFFENLPGKIEIFLTPGSTTPQISNQIDAAELCHVIGCIC